MEIWKPIANVPNYMISNYGRIKSLQRGKERLISISHTKDGYPKCSLWVNNKLTTFRVSRLVAINFIPNPENKTTVNHIDGNKDNNHVENLEWATLNEQMKHAYKKGLKKPMRGVLQKVAKLTENDVKYIREHYKSRDKNFGMNALAKKFNVSNATIKRAAKGITYFNIK